MEHVLSPRRERAWSCRLGLNPGNTLWFEHCPAGLRRLPVLQPGLGWQNSAWKTHPCLLLQKCQAAQPKWEPGKAHSPQQRTLI